MVVLVFAVVVVLGSGVQIEWLTVENSPASVQETFVAVRHGVDGQALTGIGSSHVVDVPLGLFLHPFHFDNLPESRLATEASTEVSDTVPVFRFVSFAIKYDNFFLQMLALSFEGFLNKESLGMVEQQGKPYFSR